MLHQILSQVVGVVILGGFPLLVLLLIVRARRKGRARELRTTPTVHDLTALGYDRGVATAALRHLEAEKATGRMRYYTYLGHGGSWGWYVTLETVQATAKPSEYRVDLGDWVHMFIMGTLPEAGGAA